MDDSTGTKWGRKRSKVTQRNKRPNVAEEHDGTRFKRNWHRKKLLELIKLTSCKYESIRNKKNNTYICTVNIYTLVQKYFTSMLSNHIKTYYSDVTNQNQTKTKISNESQ